MHLLSMVTRLLLITIQFLYNTVSYYLYLPCVIFLEVSHQVDEYAGDVFLLWSKFITTWNGITITTSKVASVSDLSIMEKYFKRLKDINVDKNITPCLLQSKSYLKILEVFYYRNNSSMPITNFQVKEILSQLDMFNDITLASCSQVVKVSPKSDIAIIQIDIWDSQNSTKTRRLINRYFNFGYYVVTFHRTSMNPRMPQCKNCWKQEHTIYICQVHMSSWAPKMTVDMTSTF